MNISLAVENGWEVGEWEREGQVWAGPGGTCSCLGQDGSLPWRRRGDAESAGVWMAGSLLAETPTSSFPPTSLSSVTEAPEEGLETAGQVNKS